MGNQGKAIDQRGVCPTHNETPVTKKGLRHVAQPLLGHWCLLDFSFRQRGHKLIPRRGIKRRADEVVQLGEGAVAQALERCSFNKNYSRSSSFRSLHWLTAM